MRKILNIWLISFFVALIPLNSFAAAPDRRNEYLGEKCNTPPKGSGIVAGFFRGWEEAPMLFFDSDFAPVESYRCFKTMKECKTWLFTMNYYYNEKTPDVSMCTLF